MKSKPLIKILPILGFLCCLTQNAPAAAEEEAKPVRKYDSRRFRSGLPYIIGETPEQPAIVKPAASAAPAATPNTGSLALPDRRIGFQPVRKDSASRLSAHEKTGETPIGQDRRDAYPPAKLTSLAATPAPQAKPNKGFFSFLTNPPPAKKRKSIAAPTPAAEIAVAKPAKPAPVTPVAPQAKPAPRPFAFLFNQPARKPKAARAPKVPNENIATPTTQRKPLFSFLQKKEPPKALLVESTPSVKKTATNPAVRATANQDLSTRTKPDSNDGLRLPDMLTLPGEDEFQSTSPAAPPSGGGTGAVISRPPTDPPSRPKAKEKDGE